tara:strand:- start:500 stop:874 length:375 start_codon:yes stop_codon:yes gene_type:complete
MPPSYSQSSENYDYFYDSFKKELLQEGGFQKVTRVRILNRFLEKGLINKEYYKFVLKDCILKDKKDDKYDMLSSLLISTSIILFALIVFIPRSEIFIRILFGVYILIIYLIIFLFYKNQLKNIN